MTTQPTIKLKSIQINMNISDETPCYSAKVYVDGRYFAKVSNHGHGGPDDVTSPTVNPQFDDELRTLETLIGETFPENKYDFGGGRKGSYKETLECICQEAAWNHVEERNLRSRLSKKVMTVTKDGEVLFYKQKKTVALLDFARKQLQDGERVLNDLPFAEAMQIYKATAA